MPDEGWLLDPIGVAHYFDYNKKAHPCGDTGALCNTYESSSRAFLEQVIGTEKCSICTSRLRILLQERGIDSTRDKDQHANP